MNSKLHRFLVLVAVLACFTHPASAQKLLADGIRDLSDQISQSAVREKKQRIAILPLRELYGEPTALGAYLSEEITTLLVQTGKFQVVERSQLDRILAELKLGRSGLIDPETAKRVGKLAGADALLTGTISDLATFVAVNCRMIDGLTGDVLGAAQVKIAKDADVAKIMAIAASPIIASASQPGMATSPAPKAPAAKDFRKEEKGVSFELKQCTASSKVVECNFLITSLDKDQRLEMYGPGGSRLFDSEGNEIPASKIVLGTGSSDYELSVSARLIAGVAVKARLTFPGVSTDAATASVVEIRVYVVGDGTWFTLQFRDVPIQRP